MGVDHGGDGVGGIVKAIDELEAQGDYQGHPEQQERGPGGDHRAAGVDVLDQAPGGVQQTRKQQAEEQGQGTAAGLVVQARLCFGCGWRRTAGQRWGSHNDSGLGYLRRQA
ncbi:hypothetical protein D3C77_469120 [compost metagenome]